MKIKDLDAGTEEMVAEPEVQQRLAQLLPAKAGRRVVYQQRDEAADAGATPAAEASG